MNQFKTPYGLTQDEKTGLFYIADTFNYRIMVYTFGNSSGLLVAGQGTAGCSNTQFNASRSVYFDSITNSLLISSHYCHQIVRWILGATNWTLVAGSSSGLSGSNSNTLRYPVGLTLDPMRNLYIADAYNFRVQFFLPGQSNGTTIVRNTTMSGSNVSLANVPYGVALDNQLNLFVSDFSNHQVLKFLRY